MYYHVSRKDLGEKVVFTPKIPECANYKECKSTLRVCFCPTLPQCIIAIVSIKAPTMFDVLAEFLPNKKAKVAFNPSVYVTRKRLSKPVIVDRKRVDYDTTGEMWSTKPIEVKRKGYIDLKCLMFEFKLRITQDSTWKVNHNEIAIWWAAEKATRIRF